MLNSKFEWNLRYETSIVCNNLDQCFLTRAKAEPKQLRGSLNRTLETDSVTSPKSEDQKKKKVITSSDVQIFSQNQVASGPLGTPLKVLGY